MTEEYGLALSHGPFETERDAYEAARREGAKAFVTGRTERGWFWALEEEYHQIGGNKLIAINGLRG